MTSLWALSFAALPATYAIPGAFSLNDMEGKADLIIKAKAISTEPAAADPAFKPAQGFEVHATTFKVISAIKGEPGGKIIAFRHYVDVAGSPSGFALQYADLPQHYQFAKGSGSTQNAPDEKGKIYRVVGKTFSGEVCFEFGNFDYLMGADVDTYHPEVREDLFRWGEWFFELTGVHGFRLDAIKHIPATFFKDWLGHLRGKYPDRPVFAVGEYWSGDVEELHTYLKLTEGATKLFDVPLHFNFRDAARGGRDFDLRRVFDKTLVKDNPLVAVTFVDNHDSQPGQALESWVMDWFKPLAYALILLRRDGYPCVFYGDYFGNPGDERENHKLVSHRKLIDDFLQARAKHMYGEQHDYFDHPTCVGWLWTGDAAHPVTLAVVMSTCEAGTRRMKTLQPCKTFRDLTGHWPEPVTADDTGEAEFRCPPGKVSVWCTC